MQATSWLGWALVGVIAVWALRWALRALRGGTSSPSPEPTAQSRHGQPSDGAPVDVMLDELKSPGAAVDVVLDDLKAPPTAQAEPRPRRLGYNDDTMPAVVPRAGRGEDGQANS